MKTILSIAGSDSSGGAGIQADIKTACYFKVYSCTAITSITAQNTQTVKEIYNLPPKIIAGQIRAVLEDIKIDISNELLEFIIENYTNEGGVRKLKEILNDIFLEINLRKLEKNKISNALFIFVNF
jgi:ATP-dependent Lon protease